MAFTLPPLPYPANALEPSIDAQTMEIHHDRHHKAYVDNLNKAIEGHADLQSKSIQELLRDINRVPENIRTAGSGGGRWKRTCPQAPRQRPTSASGRCMFSSFRWLKSQRQGISFSVPSSRQQTWATAGAF